MLTCWLCSAQMTWRFALISRPLAAVNPQEPWVMSNTKRWPCSGVRLLFFFIPFYSLLSLRENWLSKNVAQDSWFIYRLTFMTFLFNKSLNWKCSSKEAERHLSAFRFFYVWYKLNRWSIQRIYSYGTLLKSKVQFTQNAPGPTKSFAPTFFWAVHALHHPV